MTSKGWWSTCTRHAMAPHLKRVVSESLWHRTSLNYTSLKSMSAWKLAVVSLTIKSFFTMRNWSEMIPLLTKTDSRMKKASMIWNLLKSTIYASRLQLMRKTRKRGSTCSTTAMYTWSTSSEMRSWPKLSIRHLSHSTPSHLACLQSLVRSSSWLCFHSVSHVVTQRTNSIREKKRGTTRPKMVEVMWHLRDINGLVWIESHPKSKGQRTSEKWTKIAK